jgi:hypothetical protein
MHLPMSRETSGKRWRGSLVSVSGEHGKRALEGRASSLGMWCWPPEVILLHAPGLAKSNTVYCNTRGCSGLRSLLSWGSSLPHVDHDRPQVIGLSRWLSNLTVMRNCHSGMWFLVTCGMWFLVCGMWFLVTCGTSLDVLLRALFKPSSSSHIIAIEMQPGGTLEY